MPLELTARRDLRILVGLSSVSGLGDQVALIALFLRVARGGISSHGWLVAALAVAGALPFLLLAGPAGLLVDWVRARPLLVALGLGEAAVSVGLGAWHGDVLTVGLMALLSCCVAVSRPGYNALVPSLVGPDHVAAAQARIQAGQSLALALGPAVGGVLVGSLGQSVPLYVDALSFALAALATTFVRGDRTPVPHAASEERGAMAAGARFIAQSPTLRPVVVTAAFLMLGLGAINVAEVFMATVTLHASALAYGMTGVAFGVGSIVGSLLGGRAPGDPHRLMRDSLVIVAILGALMAVIGLVTSIPQMLLVLLPTGILVGLVNVFFATLFAAEAPAELRGRVYAAAGGVFTAAELASMVLGGALLATIAPRTIFQLAGVVATASVVIVAPIEVRLGRRRALAAQGE